MVNILNKKQINFPWKLRVFFTKKPEKTYAYTWYVQWDGGYGLLPSNKRATCYIMGLIRGPICAWNCIWYGYATLFVPPTGHLVMISPNDSAL
jgi:hypothetical protein